VWARLRCRFSPGGGIEIRAGPAGKGKRGFCRLGPPKIALVCAPCCASLTQSTQIWPLPDLIRPSGFAPGLNWTNLEFLMNQELRIHSTCISSIYTGSSAQTLSNFTTCQLHDSGSCGKRRDCQPETWSRQKMEARRATNRVGTNGNLTVPQPLQLVPDLAGSPDEQVSTAGSLPPIWMSGPQVGGHWGPQRRRVFKIQARRSRNASFQRFSRAPPRCRHIGQVALAGSVACSCRFLVLFRNSGTGIHMPATHVASDTCTVSGAVEKWQTVSVDRTTVAAGSGTFEMHKSPSDFLPAPCGVRSTP
jgi:hypothetical protein